MLIKNRIGNIQSFDTGERLVDYVHLSWYEVSKRMLHKTSNAGLDITLKFLQQDPAHQQGDILFENEEGILVIDILAAECIIVTPISMHQMASLCYEIGNKHLPLFMEGDELLIPFDEPLFRWLKVSGFEPFKDMRKLLHPLKTTTTAHAHPGGGSLFSKIMQLTKNSSDE